MKTTDEIKADAFREFLKRLGTHKMGECMDIVSMDVDYKKIKVQKK
jgi:hypothetical protein